LAKYQTVKLQQPLSSQVQTKCYFTVGDTLVGILQGLAGGTLLYITFFEVLDRTKLEKSGMDGILGVILMLIGFGFMTGLTIMGEVL